MKKILSAIAGLLLHTVLFSQDTTLVNTAIDSTNFKIIDIQQIAGNYMLVTCRDNSGRTVQFFTGSYKPGNGNTNPILTGNSMIVDFNLKKVYAISDTANKYKIINPSFSNACCVISRIDSAANDSTDIFFLNKDSANVIMYFNRKKTGTNPPQTNIQLGQLIHQLSLNNKTFAILRPVDKTELSSNIFYSYELNLMAKEIYNSLYKSEKQIDTITPAANTVLSNVSSIDTDTVKTEISSIPFGKNMGTGIIHIDVPPGVEYTMAIYSPADSSLLFNSNKQQSFSLFPGTYDVKISGISIKNIPVSKGSDTRIKAGSLGFTYNVPWTLYTDNKSGIQYTSPGPKKIAVPIGRYQLKINERFHPVEIKDAATLEFDSSKYAKEIPVVNDDSSGIKIQSNIADSNKIITLPPVPVVDSTNRLKQPSNTLIIEKNWEIRQNSSNKNGIGKILVNVPKEVECIITISQAKTGKEVYYSGELTKQRIFTLMPGLFDVKISGYMLKNVPVQKGMDTKVRVGILNVANQDIWTLYDENKSQQVYFSPTAKKIGLPIGIYQIEINGKMWQIEIKEGEVREIL